MRSKISCLGLLISSFVLVIAFQNCSNVNEAIPGLNETNSNLNPNDGSTNTCLAIAVPYIKLGFIFSSTIPQGVEVDINGELVYSDCGREATHGTALREGSRLEFYKGYDSINDVPAALDIHLYRRDCSSSNRTLLTHVQEIEPNYEVYSLCGTSAVRLEVDYLVN